jgi:predicted transcriptional regulator of viral defense system
MRELFATVAREAAKQHGRISARQLREAGVDKSCAHRWLADGRLHRMHVGVYAVGHRAPSLLATYTAAVLAGGDGAKLSHAPCGHLLKLQRGASPPPEVTVPTTAHRRRPGIVIHRVRELAPQDVSELHGIPITTVPRTLLDLAPRLTPAQLARACHEAWVQHETTPAMVTACIARNPPKPGAAKLRTALEADVTFSDLENGFVDLLRAHDLSLPRTNIDHHGDKVDCQWPQHDLTVELLSHRFHASRAAFEQDVARRRRSNHVASTYGDVFERDAATIDDLRARLGTRRHS